PKEETPETGVGEASTGPRLFSELGMGITTRDVVIPTVEGTEAGAVESEAGVNPSPPILTGRRKGGPFRRVVEAEARPGVEGVMLSGEQRRLILEAWARSEVTEGLAASAGAVARVLREAGYESEERPTERHEDKPREFERARPNQLWQSDLFTFLLKREGRRLYLVGFMDDHSRYIVGFGLYASS